jgi:hypothetical protein
VAVLAGSGLLAWLDDVGVPVVMSNWLWWQGQLINPFSTLVTVQPWWVHVALNALNWPADGCVTTNSAEALMTPPPMGTSAVFTGVPLGAAALDDPDEFAEPVDVDELVDDELAEVVALDAAAPVAGGVLEPPHAARAAAPATPAPPTPAARSTVRRLTAAPFTSACGSDVPGDLEVVVSGSSDMAASASLIWSGASRHARFKVPKLVAGSTNREWPIVPMAAVNHLW